MKEKEYELIIIGGGPAGVAAGVYAARKKLKTLVITKDFGGQSMVSETIENWIGEIIIKGVDLQKKLADNIKHYRSDDFVINEFQFVESILKVDEGFEVKNNLGKTFFTKSVIVTTGAKRRQLQVSGAKEFEHKGLTYCASCDGPLFTGKDVVVIGGGNSGFESASQLLAYARSVTLLHRGSEYRAEPQMVENVLANEKMFGILNANIYEVFGDSFVNGIKYTDMISKKEVKLDVSGVFVEIGAIPATDFISEDLIEKDNIKQIKIDHRNGRTSQAGIWAAGDCTDSLFKQNNIAMGDAVKCIEDIYSYLKT
jgi:alkyl hydroperoxide reductase subunit F